MINKKEETTNGKKPLGTTTKKTNKETHEKQHKKKQKERNKGKTP